MKESQAVLTVGDAGVKSQQNMLFMTELIMRPLLFSGVSGFV
jgi:hypothetical protein